MAKSSALPFVLRESGFRGFLGHISSVIFGDPKFNRPASSIDMRNAGLNFLPSLEGMIIQLCPNIPLNEIKTTILEADESIRIQDASLQKFPKQWDSGRQLKLLLYVLVRLNKPNVVVETGTANGSSAAAICAALSKNGTGHLWSFDVLESSAPQVQNSHRNFLTLMRVNGKSDTLKREVARLKTTSGFSIFLHDSDHSYPNQISDYQTAKNLGFNLLISDDVDASLAFTNFARENGIVLLDGSKFIGALQNHQKEGTQHA